jgi:hypothetical protein
VSAAVLALGIAVMAAACGGGGGTTAPAAPIAPPVATASPVSTASVADAAFRFIIPGGQASSSAKKRTPKYISSATATIKLSLLSVGTNTSPGVAPLTITVASPPMGTSCGPDPANSANTLCTTQYPIPAGSDTVQINAYDSSNDLLSSQTLTQTITLGITNTFTFTLDANPNNATWVVTSPSGVTGTQNGGYTTVAGSGQQSFSFTLYDAAGKVIAGPGAPTYSAVVAPSSLAAESISGQTLTLTPGNVGTGTVTLTATPGTTTSGLTAGTLQFAYTVTAATPTPSPSPSPTPTATPTPTPVPTATPVAGVIADPGFESHNVTTYTAGGVMPAPGTGGWTQCTIGTVPAAANPEPQLGPGVTGAPTPHPHPTFTPFPGSTPAAIELASGSVLATPAPYPTGTGTPVPVATPVPTVSQMVVNSGSYGALFGQVFSNYNAGDYYYNGLCQNITVPTGLSNLTFYTFGNSNENSTYVDFDVILLNPTTQAFGTWLYTEAQETGTAYHQVSVPMSSYAGNTYTLFMGMWTKSGSTKNQTTYSGYQFLDDVALTPVPVTANPTSVNLNGTGSANQGTTVISQAGFTGSFTESDTCSAYATVTPTSGASPLNVTVVGTNAGTCSATFTAGGGQSVNVPITVTVTNYTVNGKRRK